MPFNLFDETFLVQNAAGTFLSTNPNDDDGGQRAHQELQESLARRPVKLPAFELVELWEKAKADPTSLTEEERLRILERWPLDDFNAKCQAICGMALEELLDKAANSPEDLTREEARMLIYGVEKRSLGDDPNLERLRWPSDLRDLQRKAIAAAETEQDRTALKNAREAQRKGIDRKHEARNILNEDDRKNVVWCNRSSWAKKLDQEQPDQEWGFVLYRTCFEDDQSWRKFQQELANLTNVALTLVKDSEGIRKRWKIHYIEERGLEGTSLETLAEFVFLIPAKIHIHTDAMRVEISAVAYHPQPVMTPAYLLISVTMPSFSPTARPSSQPLNLALSPLYPRLQDEAGSGRLMLFILKPESSRTNMASRVR